MYLQSPVLKIFEFGLLNMDKNRTSLSYKY
jgi:hypothetical protein